MIGGRAAVALTSILYCAASVAENEATKVDLIIEPGYWEVITRPELPGVPFPPSSRSDLHCLSADDITNGLLGLRFLAGCKATGGRRQGSLLEQVVKCEDPHLRGMGGVVGQGTRFAGRIEIQVGEQQDGQATKFTYHYLGRRLNTECPPGVSRKTTTP